MNLNKHRKVTIHDLHLRSRQAHDIVERQLQEHLGHESLLHKSLLWLRSKEIKLTGSEQVDKTSTPLCMLILGEAGIGKSMFVGAITENFEHYRSTHLLAKCAATGIAASDIGAQTLHSREGVLIRMPER